MNFFKKGISISEAEELLEKYISDYEDSDFYLKDIPLTYEDYELILHMVPEYSKNIYSYDDYQNILLLFIVYSYIIFKTTDTKNIFRELFLNDASHIPQHHLRHLIYLLSNIFTEFSICVFNNKCDTLEDIVDVIKKHADMN